MNQTLPETHAALIRDEEQMLLEKEARYCSHGDTVHYAENPKFFDRCEGSYLYDLHGQEYLDLQMWYSAVNLGYANPVVTKALLAQMDKLPQLACQYLHREKIELAEMICESVERGFGMKGRVHFNVGGAQAVEDALKLVRKTTGRQRMLAFQGGYHGRTLGASAITSSYRYREAFGEFADRAEFIPFPYPFRSPFRGDAVRTEDWCIGEFERLFEHEYTGAWNSSTGHSEFGAFFVEAVQGTGGYVIPPKRYFRRLAKICKEHGILLVDDEIQMGFHRTGKMWAMEHFDARPDIIVFGKALTNGMNPISGIWAREEIINPGVFGPGSTHSTFASNTLGTATGLAVMKILAGGDYEAGVMNKGAYFLDKLREIQARHKEVGDIDGLGLALRMEMCEADGFTPSRKLADRMFQIGLDGNLPLGPRNRMGLVLDIGGYYKNVITLAPSLDITTAEMDLAAIALDHVLTRAKALP
ncbi:MAG: aminotransferase class III-fold pyridoxal phosphate-dependent enzyme [Betaproteobacteria bacterium]|nr:aminotransferase class III-fold pyridoxal phosphate-dependent enzyme [Betaproteobacteria bacterium]